MMEPTGIAIILTDDGEIDNGGIRLDFRTPEDAEEVMSFVFKYGLYATTFPTYYEEGEVHYENDSRNEAAK